MKQWILYVVLALAGCAQAPVPDWQQNTAAALDRYRMSLLAGDRNAAAGDFREALREAKRGGDISQLATVYLTQCALQQALLEFDSCPDYRALASLGTTAAHQAYFDWLQAAPALPDVPLLPAAYRELALHLEEKNPQAIHRIVSRIDTPVSRLIACGTVVKTGRADPALLQLAIETAARQGWKSAHLVYRKQLADVLEKAGRVEEAHQQRRLIEVLR